MISATPHFKRVCKYCKGVTAQCRCPSPDKAVIDVVCDKCALDEAERRLAIAPVDAGVSAPFRGIPVTCELRKDQENPVRYSGVLTLPGATLARVYHWPAKELPLWRMEVPAPEGIDGDGRVVIAAQAHEFQTALAKLEQKLESIRSWVERALPRPAAPDWHCGEAGCDGSKTAPCPSSPAAQGWSRTTKSHPL